MGAKDNAEEVDDHVSDVDRDAKQSKEVDLGNDPARDTIAFQGEVQGSEDNQSKRVSRVPKKVAKKETTDSFTRTTKSYANRHAQVRLQYKATNNNQIKSPKPNHIVNASKNIDVRKTENTKVPSRTSSEISEEVDDKAIDEAAKEIDVFHEAANYENNAETDDEMADAEANVLDDDRTANGQIADMEVKIEKLEQELREVAALEISIYSVAPEHGSSAHKVHTPARRLSRFYAHACKHWSPEKKATVSGSIVSGLVLIAKSCGNDVPRLTFWLSNTVVLREIINQTFGNSSLSSANGTGKNTDVQPMSSMWRNKSACSLEDNHLAQGDWQDTRTFISALENIESWIFSRIVESVWWQSLTPHMQTPMEDSLSKSFGRLLGPALGDQQQGSFSINLWNSAFHDAFARLCPLRSGGHECGCLPVLAKLVMEQCVARLDVAMFNAILRESAREIPTDPVSDPIVDTKVLPIHAGDLSFGSGAQLKNSIGNWSRMLADAFGIDDDDCGTNDSHGADCHDGDGRRSNPDSKSFHLLNQLSDLLMLPKDMLLERSIRKEVCPSIGLSLVTRILCNFTPDEFCPDPVPCTVLEELNSESMLERLMEKDVISSFPYLASPVIYHPPSPSDVAAKVSDAGANAELDRRGSMIKRRGYTSDDDLQELDSPLASIVAKGTPGSYLDSPTLAAACKQSSLGNLRYELLREVWSERLL